MCMIWSDRNATSLDRTVIIGRPPRRGHTITSVDVDCALLPLMCGWCFIRRQNNHHPGHVTAAAQATAS